MPRFRCNRLVMTFCAMCILCMAVIGGSYADDPANGDEPPYLSINGEVTILPTSAPIMALGEILVPLEDMIGEVGGQIQQGAGEGEYVVTREGISVQFTMYQQEYSVDGDQRLFYIPPIMVGGLVYVDARDMTEALGGQYAWSRETLTADLTFGEVAAPTEGRTVVGTLRYVGKQEQPVWFLVTPEGENQARAFTGAAAIEYVRAMGGGETQASSLEQLQPGQHVELRLNAEDKVVRVAILANRVTGTIDYIGQGLILLDTPEGRRDFRLAEGVQVQRADGSAADVGALQEGDEVTVVLGAGQTVERITITGQ